MPQEIDVFINFFFCLFVLFGGGVFFCCFFKNRDWWELDILWAVWRPHRSISSLLKGRLTPWQICSQCLFIRSQLKRAHKRVSGLRMTTSLENRQESGDALIAALLLSLQNPLCDCFRSQLSPCFAATATQKPSCGSAENRSPCITETKRSSSRWGTKNHSFTILWTHHTRVSETKQNLRLFPSLSLQTNLHTHSCLHR